MWRSSRPRVKKVTGSAMVRRGASETVSVAVGGCSPDVRSSTNNAAKTPHSLLPRACRGHGANCGVGRPSVRAIRRTSRRTGSEGAESKTVRPSLKWAATQWCRTWTIKVQGRAARRVVARSAARIDPWRRRKNASAGTARRGASRRSRSAELQQLVVSPAVGQSSLGGRSCEVAVMMASEGRRRTVSAAVRRRWLVREE